MKQSSKILIACSLSICIILAGVLNGYGQIQSTDKRYIRIGSLQNHVSAYGSERAWNNTYYEGLRWPSEYKETDNSVIQRMWIGCQDFTNPFGSYYETYAISFYADNCDAALYPVKLEQTAKFQTPTVFVDGTDITAPYAEDVDKIDETIIPDRIVENVVNTSMGLTITRRIMAFSQQYHSSYMIREYTYTNTGNTNYDDDIELDQPLKGVRIGFGIRYSVCREGSYAIGGEQSWGKFSWVTKRGETYAQHAGERITEADPIVDWIRCGFEWAGQKNENAFDNVGGPWVQGTGRLRAPQHAGVAVLHVDKSATDKSDDVEQPLVLGWHAGDTYPGITDQSQSSIPNMTLAYQFISGSPYRGLGGNERFDEKYMATKPDPSTVHQDGGGTNVWICYGPWDLEIGESITIVEAEAVNGLDHVTCEEIGKRWLKAHLDPADKGPFTLPDGSTTTDKNVYKNTWVYTGKDSIIMMFGRAKRAFDAGYQIPQPPLPPPSVYVNSGGDRINISWIPSLSENEAGFAGYKVFRAVGKTDTTYEEIYDGGPGIYSFDDTDATRGQSYYYYVVAYNDGSNNTSGESNPTGQLMSSRFYTQTTEPAYLRRAAGSSLDSIRVVPNPYNIKARDLQYIGEPDKIMFLNIPGHCIIRIYSERGDLVQTIEHENGSGDEAWNSVTSSRQVVVSGIYIAHFEVTQDQVDEETERVLYKKGDSAYRKFVIIR
ncbi:fibronectin [candidate division KSB1 bacterium]|nr:fibronectin [candidate division KSB1 bacterium]